MPRHKEEGAAITHIRISYSTKQLLDQLKKKHGFATSDKVLQYYLPQDTTDNKPVFLTAKQAYDLTHRQPIDRLIKDAAAEVMKKTNNSHHNVKGCRLDHTRTKPANNKSIW